MDKTKIREVLENLEKKASQKKGYDAKQILNELNMEINENNEKALRGSLRTMISKKLYPEFATAGSEDIVYSPEGKGSGRYRLSIYRGK